MSMLKKAQRLSRSDFTACFSAGRRYHSPSLTIITCPSSSFHGAVVVGKKVSKLAVQRNRLRRSLYGVLYELKDTLLPAGTYIVLVKPAAAKAPAAGVRQELRELCQKVASHRKAR